MTRSKAIRFCSKAEKKITWMTAHLEISPQQHVQKSRIYPINQLAKFSIVGLRNGTSFQPVFKNFFISLMTNNWMVVWVILSALNSVGHCFCLLGCFLKLIWLLFLKIPEFITKYADNPWKEIKKRHNKCLKIAREVGLCIFSGEWNIRPENS